MTSKVYPNAKINGPYFCEANDRWCVGIYEPNKLNTKMLLARFLMQEHLGRLLKTEEEVDHVDENKYNDVIENLQILTKAQNIAKRNASQIKYTNSVSAICAFCEVEFKLTRTQQYERARTLKKETPGPFCSKSHASKYREQFRG